MATKPAEASCFKFVVRGQYEDTIRYLERERREKHAKADVRFAFDTRKCAVDQNCQTPESFFKDVLNLHHATGTIRRKRALIQENRNRYSKDSGFSEGNSLDRNGDYKVSLEDHFRRTPLRQLQPAIDTSDLVLDQNIIDLIDIGRFSHLTTPDPLQHVLNSQEAHFAAQANGPAHDYSDPDLTESDFFNRNALEIQRISPTEATFQTSRSVKNRHLQDVIRTGVKNKVARNLEHATPPLSDLFEELDSLCDEVADRISEKMGLRSEGSSMTSSSSPALPSPLSDLARRRSEFGSSPVNNRRRSDFYPSSSSSPSSRKPSQYSLDLGGLNTRKLSHYDLDLAMANPPKPSRISIDLGTPSLDRSQDDLDRPGFQDHPRFKCAETQYSPEVKRKKKRKSKRLFRSNSAGDILDEAPELRDQPLGDQLQPLRDQPLSRKKGGSTKRKSSIFEEFKRRVSIFPSDKEPVEEVEEEEEEVIPPPPPPQQIKYEDNTSCKDQQTPQYLQKQHAKVMSEIKDAMEMAQIDIPAMFIYDVDLQGEVLITQPGDNRIFQLEKACAVCQGGFKKSAYIVCSGGLFWHSQCFVCVQCFQPFKDPNDPSQESVFYEHEDRPYCHNCYTVNFAPMCFTCGGWVIGRVIEALDVKWHPECFGCYMCGAELCENGFYKHIGRPICIDCHDLVKKKKQHICNKCFMTIDEYILWYLKEPYHPYHFSCQNCFKPLDNKYKDKDSNFYCQLCYDTVIQDVCAACKKAIDGRAIKAAGKAWCPEHFLCYSCERPLTGDKFMLNEGKPYCQYHYMKQFGVRCFYCANRSSMQVIKVLNKNYCENHFFCSGCDSLLEEKKSKVIEMDMKPYCRHCYDKFPSDMRRKLLDSANQNAKNKKATMKKDKKGSMKKPKKEKKSAADNREITNATETAS